MMKKSVTVVDDGSIVTRGVELMFVVAGNPTMEIKKRLLKG